MVSLLASKVSALGVIMLAVSFDAYKPNCSFIVHLPVLSDQETESVLSKDLGEAQSSLTDMIVQGVVRFFATETHSLSELRSLRDMALSSCITNGYNTQGGSLRGRVIE